MSISQKANIYSFQDPVPSRMYWDAGFIISFASKNSKYHEDCANFLKILEKGKVTCVVSTLALDESWFVILQAKIEEDFAPKSFWQVFNKDKEVIKGYIPDLERLTTNVYRQPYVEIIGIEPEWSFSVLENMSSYCFLPRDAYHLQAMYANRIENLVTLDEDFVAVPNINIYTCNPSISTKKSPQ
jgi:predicted nucleic acid-binding protein